MNILLIEDNLTIIKGLKYAFLKNNYNLVSKTTIQKAQEYLNQNSQIDLIILDITMPDGNGLYFYEDTIKKMNIPTIFLTAVASEEVIVKSLDLGAEDYLTKPFSTKELLVRVKKVLMRHKKTSIIKVKDISFNMDKMVIYKNEKKLDFSPLELKILQLLFFNLNKVVTRNVILDKIWEVTGSDVDDHTITVYLKRIREKLQSDIITTIKGIGYRIDEK